MVWGANKLTKKILKPKAVNNNELLDYISRVPDNEQLVRFSRSRRLPACHVFGYVDDEGKPHSNGMLSKS